jgi:hypothetical protein
VTEVILHFEIAGSTIAKKHTLPFLPRAPGVLVVRHSDVGVYRMDITRVRERRGKLSVVSVSPYGPEGLDFYVKAGWSSIETPSQV